MTQIEIKGPADLQKLEGWTVQKLGIVPGPILILEMSHPLAEKHILVRIKPDVKFGLTSSLLLGGQYPLVADLSLNISTEDL